MSAGRAATRFEGPPPSLGPVGVVVLAAGQGARFGSVKQLAEVAGRPLVVQALDPVLHHPRLTRHVVVLGAHADRVEPLVVTALGRDVDVRRCPDWIAGPIRSLATGLRALGGCEWALVLLGDEVGVPRAAVDRVLEAAERPSGAACVRATWAGRPGHPLLLHRSLWPSILGARHGVRPQEVLAGRGLPVPCDDLGDPLDVDRPTDLESARLRSPLETAARARRLECRPPAANAPTEDPRRRRIHTDMESKEQGR